MVEIILWYVITCGVTYLWTKWRDADKRAERCIELLETEHAAHKKTLQMWEESDKTRTTDRQNLLDMYGRCYDRMHFFEKLYCDSQKRLPGDEWKDLQEPEMKADAYMIGERYRIDAGHANSGIVVLVKIYGKNFGRMRDPETGAEWDARLSRLSELSE